MKKIIIFASFILIAIGNVSFAQEAGKETTTRKEGFFHRVFHSETKPRAQMQHFDKTAKDPNLKHNGTSYWNSRRKTNKQDKSGKEGPVAGKKP